MSQGLIIGYKLLADKIAEKYGIGTQVLLYSTEDLTQLSEAFGNELSFSGLLWLGTILDRGSKVQEELVDQVNLINKAQRERFATFCRANNVLLPPINVINLN